MAFVVVVSLGWGRVGLCGGVGVVRTLGSGMVELLVGGLDEGALRLRALKKRWTLHVFGRGVFWGWRCFGLCRWGGMVRTLGLSPGRAPYRWP